ncbi:DUF4179 domain-containing protein [Senegalia massiliensis]|uniref:DUF4179 domain-containing protein n=1 Tax=Senegalia massiliensis TaxID=1720316 RepID=A0A845QU46_9CLOT|nr:DUF4179 domain-containing protein [Senegalia massiliensis]NBI05554.1 DUF4179 domain-containing protein [Senegalia massiliensis]
MNNIEKMLKNKKKELDKINAPDNLEYRLTKALEDKQIPKRNKSKLIRIIAASLVFLLIGYNFDALAFYGKKILGYDNVMNGAIKDLNEQGKGQIINKSYTFENDVSVKLDAIMIDDSQLLAFYTIKDPSGNAQDMIPQLSLKGLINEYSPEGGQGKSNDEGTMIKYIQSFETPYFFERTLDFKIHLFNENINEEGEISFKIDRDKAMGNTLKSSINKTIKIDREDIHFDSILASPTRTIIKGSIQNIFELAKDTISNERLRPDRIEIKLYANDEELQSQGGGSSTDLKGITFHKEYDPLPKDLKSLKLELVSFSGDNDVNEIIDINKEIKNKDFKIYNQNVLINNIEEKKGKTLITITTEEDVVISELYLLANEKKIELNRTTDGKHKKLKDGKILYTRTLEFEGVGENYKLDIRRMTYSKEYNKVIDIPID